MFIRVYIILTGTGMTMLQEDLAAGWKQLNRIVRRTDHTEQWTDVEIPDV